jgi:hypothetical protein
MLLTRWLVQVCAYIWTTYDTCMPAMSSPIFLFVQVVAYFFFNSVCRLWVLIHPEKEALLIFSCSLGGCYIG